MDFRILDMDLSIIDSEKSHINDIQIIEPLAFGKHHWSSKAFLSEFNSNYSVYKSAIYDSKTVGYIGSWIIGDEGHITTLAVHPQYRKKHIADILLYSLFIELKSKDVKWLTLEVRVSNIAAINLYKKFKFKQLGIRKKYYQDNNEDGLILWTENIQNPENDVLLNEIINQVITKKTNADKL